jgi:hypothetical protein
MLTRLRKIAKYVALPVMLLSSGMAFHTQNLLAANQGATDQSAISRSSLGSFVSPVGPGTGGPSITRTTSVTPPLAQSSNSMSLLDQAREISKEAI